ncbi:Efflux transporter periplasmic adaptor subunit [Paraburkholderia tropica]|uniref:efflux RND transporter periplasmic adaptor subunit n=1 Tax=Paraburkholderia tropica TaxID=92647 RepID=UPI001CB13184|nr:efflux RND transporter periplasmic adaptor subunit [Paraburkholderia tropica]CAG9192184.1 Efflux transporter periplasmic adaptor subunit [Paraburkholderia tropica]
MADRRFFSRTPLRAAVPACCAVAVLAAAAALFASHAAHAGNTGNTAASDTPAPSAAVQTVRVSRGAVSQTLVAYGTVASAAANATTVSLPYLARVTRVLVQPGQTVARGAPLFVVQADPNAVIAYTQAQSSATLARGELARTQSLYRDGLATQSQLAAAQKALDDAQQALAAQHATGIAAGANTVTAPVAGVVAQLTAAPGDQVQAGTALAQLVADNTANAHAANVSLGIEPADALTLHAGDRVVLHPLAPALDGLQAQGRIVLVGAAVDAQSQLVNVGANVPLAGTAFLPGTRVRADIDTQTGIWWNVPRAAVLQDDRGHYVYQIAPGNKAQRVNVTVKVEHGNAYGVDGALDATRPLVVSGNDELEDGMAVRLAPAKQGGAQ